MAKDLGASHSLQDCCLFKEANGLSATILRKFTYRDDKNGAKGFSLLSLAR